mgnify:CR=1 FL=1
MRVAVSLQMSSISEIFLPGSIFAIILGTVTLLGQFFGVINLPILNRVLEIFNKIRGILEDGSGDKTEPERESAINTGRRSFEAGRDVVYNEFNFNGNDSTREKSKEAVKEALKEAHREVNRTSSQEVSSDKREMTERFNTEINSVSGDELLRDAETDDGTANEDN